MTIPVRLASCVVVSALFLLMTPPASWQAAPPVLHAQTSAPSVRVHGAAAEPSRGAAAKDGDTDKTPGEPEPPRETEPTEPIESVEPVPDVAATPPWSGRLVVDQNHRGFVDADGAWVLPIFAHFGEAFSAFIRQPEAVGEQLAAIKDAGYDGIRFWDNLGYYDVWQGRQVTPFGFFTIDDVWVARTPDYYVKLREFLVLLSQHGLAAHHSRGDLNTVGLSQVVEHSRRIRAIYADVGFDVAALYEGNNEDWQNGRLGVDGLRQVVLPLSQAGVLTALSHHSEEPEDIHDFATPELFYVHSSRGGTPTDRIRHIFSVSYEQLPNVPRLGWQGEPVGPGSSHGSTRNPEELGLLAAMSLTARQAWTYMSRNGVFWDGPIETQPGFDLVPKVRAFLDEHAPDLMSFPTLVHGGHPRAVLVSPDGYYQPEHGVNAGPARLDQAISADGRVVGLMYGGAGRKRIQNVSQHTYRLLIAQPGDQGLTVRTTRLDPGEVIELDYDVGRILVALPR